MMAALALVIQLGMVGQRWIITNIRLFAAQSLVLAVIAGTIAYFNRSPHLYVAAAMTLLLKVVVLPLWLEQQGATALQISLYAASLWLGQLPGLGVAPRLTRQFGARPPILAALLCSILALAAIALGISALWLPASLLAGFGQGLRWIGLEPWLYHIAPSHARGRLVASMKR